MLSRCYTPSKGYGYDLYGGRGVKVCDTWRASFALFRDWALAHGYSDSLFLDRINPDGDYEPDNCRFVTAKESARNKRNTIMLTALGVTRPMADWADFLDLPYRRLAERRRKGYTDEEVLFMPFNKRRKKEKTA